MHGRPSRTPSDKEAKRIAAAYRAGVPLRGLQDRFGLSVDVIKRVLAEAGIDPAGIGGWAGAPEHSHVAVAAAVASGVADALDQREAPEAPIADLELAHARMHVAAIRGLSDELRDEVAAGGPSHAQIDPDTALNVHSWSAALRAAGAALAARTAVGTPTLYSARAAAPHQAAAAP